MVVPEKKKKRITFASILGEIAFFFKICLKLNCMHLQAKGLDCPSFSTYCVHLVQHFF